MTDQKTKLVPKQIKWDPVEVERVMVASKGLGFIGFSSFVRQCTMKMVRAYEREKAKKMRAEAEKKTK